MNEVKKMWCAIVELGNGDSDYAYFDEKWEAFNQARNWACSEDSKAYIGTAECALNEDGKWEQEDGRWDIYDTEDVDADAIPMAIPFMGVVTANQLAYELDEHVEYVIQIAKPLGATQLTKDWLLNMAMANKVRQMSKERKSR